MDRVKNRFAGHFKQSPPAHPNGLFPKVCTQRSAHFAMAAREAANQVLFGSQMLAYWMAGASPAMVSQ